MSAHGYLTTVADWLPAVETLHDRLATPQFAYAWLRYLAYRWDTSREWPDAVTQQTQWAQLAQWHHPTHCVRQSIQAGYKSIHPLITDHHAYSKGTRILAASRHLRRRAERWGLARDTVIGYMALGPVL